MWSWWCKQLCWDLQTLLLPKLLHEREQTLHPLPLGPLSLPLGPLSLPLGKQGNSWHSGKFLALGKDCFSRSVSYFSYMPSSIHLLFIPVIF
jgi:hypothetical protein